MPHLPFSNRFQDPPPFNSLASFFEINYTIKKRNTTQTKHIQSLHEGHSPHSLPRKLPNLGSTDLLGTWCTKEQTQQLTSSSLCSSASEPQVARRAEGGSCAEWPHRQPTLVMEGESTGDVHSTGSLAFIFSSLRKELRRSSWLHRIQAVHLAVSSTALSYS